MPHIFGVGLNKTGTRSLAKALVILGYSATHHGVDEDIERAHCDGVPLLSYVERTDAYLDLRAVERWFDCLDEQYPGSKFILTTRDLSDWLASREEHVLQNQERARAGTFDGQWLTVDRPAWEKEWSEHHARVRAYFADRAEDLLEMDIPAGDDWRTLAPFLGEPIPDSPFPWRGRLATPPPSLIRRALSTAAAARRKLAARRRR